MVELPEAFKEVEVLHAEPRDIMVLTVGTAVSQDELDGALGELETVFPAHKCVVLGPFDKLRVVRIVDGYQVPDEAVDTAGRPTHDAAPAAPPEATEQDGGG